MAKLCTLDDFLFCYSRANRWALLFVFLFLITVSQSSSLSMRSEGFGVELNCLLLPLLPTDWYFHSFLELLSSCIFCCCCSSVSLAANHTLCQNYVFLLASLFRLTDFCWVAFWANIVHHFLMDSLTDWLTDCCSWSTFTFLLWLLLLIN